jgi:hypothetical protein
VTCSIVAYALVAAGTAWQAWRGDSLQAKTCQFKKELADGHPHKAKLLYALADGFTHGVLALTGWWSLWAAADELLELKAASDPSAGGVALAFGLGLFGLLGITGQVPTILNRWKP